MLVDVLKGGSLSDISSIASKAKITDAVALADNAASIAEIARFADKGEDLYTVGLVLEKAYSQHTGVDTRVKKNVAHGIIVALPWTFIY